MDRNSAHSKTQSRLKLDSTTNIRTGGGIHRQSAHFNNCKSKSNNRW